MICDDDVVPIFRPLGGAKNIKIEQQHKDFVVKFFEDPHFDYNSAHRIKVERFRKFESDVSASAVNYSMHLLCYTKRKKTHVSRTANYPVKLMRRKNYAFKSLEYEAMGKKMIYLDEINYNLHTTMSYAWSKKVKTAPHHPMSSKGTNLQILGAICASKDQF